MVQRVTYRRRHAYATKSNKTRIVRTPGGKLVVQYPKKKTSHPVCGVTGALLAGVRGSAGECKASRVLAASYVVAVLNFARMMVACSMGYRSTGFELPSGAVHTGLCISRR